MDISKQVPIIMIIDDELVSLEFLESILKKENYQVISVKEGLKGLEVMETILPDLILLDIMMPDINGFDLCKMIKTNERLVEIPIIFFSAYNESDNIVKGFQLGGVDFISKPFNLTEMLLRIETHVKLKKARDNQKAIQTNERKKAQANLLLFRTLIDQSNDGIYIINPETEEFLDCNARACNNLGYSRNELLFLTVKDIGLNIPEDQMVPTDQPDAVNNQPSILFEGQLQRKDGTSFPVEVSISSHIVHESLSYRVAVMRDITERKVAEEKIKASLKEKEILLREIHHRVKNNMQIISSLLQWQSHLARDDYHKIMFEESHHRIISMALVHENLYESSNLSEINGQDYINDLIKSIKQAYCDYIQNIEFDIQIDRISLNIDSAIPVGLIVNELISNAIMHGFQFPNNQKGRISIKFHYVNKDELELIIQDNGVGISSDINIRESETMGLQLITDLSEIQLGGQLIYKTNPGTFFCIRFKELTYQRRMS